jgi:hypothetical protein
LDDHNQTESVITIDRNSHAARDLCTGRTRARPFDATGLGRIETERPWIYVRDDRPLTDRGLRAFAGIIEGRGGLLGALQAKTVQEWPRVVISRCSGIRSDRVHSRNADARTWPANLTINRFNRFMPSGIELAHIRISPSRPASAIAPAFGSLTTSIPT